MGLVFLRNTRWVRFAVGSLWVWLLALGGATALAQPGPFQVEYFSTEAGIADRWVWHLQQDRQGFLWVATDNGLNRYDGYEFITFDNKPGSPVQLSGQSIYRVYLDYRDYLVLNYRFNLKFIDLFHTDSMTVHRIDLDASFGIEGKVLDVDVGADGRVYVLAFDRDHMHVYRQRPDLRFEPVRRTPWQGAPKGGDILVTRRGEIWINDDAGRLCRLDEQGAIAREWSVPDLTGYRPDRFVCMVFDERSDGSIWFSFYDVPGLYVLAPESDEFLPLPGLPAEYTYERIWPDSLGRLLVVDMNRFDGRNERIFLIHPDGRVEPFNHLLAWEPDINALISDDFLKGDLWLATQHGLLQAAPREQLVRPLVSQPPTGQQDGEWFSVRSMAVHGGTLFLTTDEHGWYRYDLAADSLLAWMPHKEEPRVVTEVQHPSRLLLVGDTALWGSNYIRNFELQLVRYDLRRDSFAVFCFPSSTYISDMIFSPQDGLFWLFTGRPGEKSRIYTFDPVTEHFTPYLDSDGSNPLENSMPQYALEDSAGIFWVGTDKGLLRLDREARRSRFYEPETAGFQHPFLLLLHEHSPGQLLVGTLGGGLHLFDTETAGVTRVWTRQDGLPNDKIAGLLREEKGHYWISTFDGLAHFDLEREKINNFYTTDGLINDEFNRLSFHRGDDGRFYFGGIRGLDSFQPEDLLPDIDFLDVPVLLAKVNYARYTDNEAVDRLDGLRTLDRIVLPASNRNCVFYFTLADFRDPAGHQYAYKLDNLDDGWHFLGHNRQVRFNHLPAGTYTLRVRAADRNNNWSEQERTLTIMVRPFFYNTGWFALLVLAGFLGLVYTFYHYQWRQRLARSESSRLRELDEAKTRLYSNITHEFRTPLTLILGRSKQLMEKLKGSDLQAVDSINQNGRRLLLLVNQLLDLRKLEAGKLEVDWVQGDVTPLLGQVFDNFRSLGERRAVRLSFQAPPSGVIMDHDPDKLIQITGNLLSNALNATPEGGSVFLSARVEEDELVLQVRDTGHGIAQEDQARIFERFYQAPTRAGGSSGTGIGLTLTRELVELMGGSISVQSEKGQGATFTVNLPVHRNAPAAETSGARGPLYGVLETAVAPAAAVLPAGGEKDLPLALIVEDNADLALFIGQCLAGSCRCLHAPDGAAGLERAIEEVPDIIISDVMMPQKNGFELVDALRRDPRTSHIPIILLTALSDAQDRLEGLRRGANVYLAKPFEPQELQLHLTNLLALRRSLWERYDALEVPARKDSGADAAGDDPFDLPQEDAFLGQVLQVIERHFADPELNGEVLCREVGTSSSQLHRKLTALTGLSPGRLIRKYRLQRARQLLVEKPGLQISEVAYRCGFNDPRYFSRVFTQEFEQSPSDYRDLQANG